MTAKTNKTKNGATFQERAEKIITEKVRPYLQGHGGDIRIKEVKNNSIWVVFTGACKTCPAARITIEEVVEKILREELGKELDQVFLVNETDEELLNFAKELLKK